MADTIRLSREEAHKLIDQMYDVQLTPVLGPDSPINESKRELPKDKRVVRTKSSGDRVYFLDEVKKTRQWVTNPEILKKLGFELPDVVEVDDSEILSYQMAAALYRVDDAKA